jgi:hypothetical protein
VVAQARHSHPPDHKCRPVVQGRRHAAFIFRSIGSLGDPWRMHLWLTANVHSDLRPHCWNSRCEITAKGAKARNRRKFGMNKSGRRVTLVLAACTGNLMLLSCGGGGGGSSGSSAPPPPAPTLMSISITPANETLTTGQTQQFPRRQRTAMGPRKMSLPAQRGHLPLPWWQPFRLADS